LSAAASTSTVAANQDSPVSASLIRSGDTKVTRPASIGVVRASYAASRTRALASV
jgi:hypothetical protein